MAKLKCVCGEILSNVRSSNEVEGLLLRGVDLEFEDKKDNCDLLELGRSVWECGECGRLGIVFEGGAVQWYRPEFENGHGLVMVDQ
jgi:hypothetical protein